MKYAKMLNKEIFLRISILTFILLGGALEGEERQCTRLSELEERVKHLEEHYEARLNKLSRRIRRIRGLLHELISARKE